MHDFEKIIMKAPCTYKVDQKRVMPLVDCEYDCGNCDWNPQEHERRMTEGQFINGKLHFKRRFK